MEVFLIAVLAAIYPTLLAAVVILLSQPRPGRLLAAYLAGGLTMSIGIGLVIVFALEGAVKSNKSFLGYGADLAIGGLALLLAVALATRADDRYRRRRARRKGTPAAPPEEGASGKEPWSQRILTKGSVPIVFVAALAINVPGGAYLVGLKDIAAGHHSTGVEVLQIVGFNLIMFSLAEIPLLGHVFAPERTMEVIKRINQWLSDHGRQLAIAVCLVLGIYLIIRGIVNA